MSRQKGLLALFLIAAGIAGVFVFFFAPSERPGTPEFAAVSWGSARFDEGFQDRRTVISGLAKSIRLLKTRGRGKTFSMPGLLISSKALVFSLERLKEILEENSSSTAVFERLHKEFIPFEIKGRGMEGDMPILATGYFQPRFKGSYNATSEYAFPVYAPPPDLVRAELKSFDPSLPAMTLWGRISGRRLVPYYSRKEIENRGILPDTLALCWLRSSVEVLELQIQGSGIIELEDGSSRFIHYAASNGRNYRSIGRMMIERGLLKKEKADWPAIKAWARRHPDKFRQVLFQNPRYIFFKWEDRGPVGSYGEVLVPGASVALDNSYYPPGIAGLLAVNWPVRGLRPAWLKKGVKTLFVFNHDKGSAIRGPGRLDLYCGTGEKAGLLAGKLKNPARLVILLHRSVVPSKSRQ